MVTGKTYAHLKLMPPKQGDDNDAQQQLFG